MDNLSKLFSVLPVNFFITKNKYFISILGRVFPNSQIVHQMPYGHVVATGQSAPTIQLQHHPTEFKVTCIKYSIKIEENKFISGS